MNNESESKSQPRRSMVIRIMQALRSDALQVVVALVSVGVSVLSLLPTASITQIPSTFLTLFFIGVVLGIVLASARFLYKQQTEQRKRVVVKLREGERELFIQLERDIPDLLGKADANE